MNDYKLHNQLIKEGWKLEDLTFNDGDNSNYPETLAKLAIKIAKEQIKGTYREFRLVPLEYLMSDDLSKSEFKLKNPNTHAIYIRPLSGDTTSHNFHIPVIDNQTSEIMYCTFP